MPDSLSTQLKPYRVYVAGSTSDTKRVNEVQQLVRDAGWAITFDWTGAEGKIITDGSWDKHSAAGAHIASREIVSCVTADLTILLSPQKPGGLGCWIEMGATLAGGGDVWVVEPFRDSVFWQHPHVRRFDSFDELLAELAVEKAA